VAPGVEWKRRIGALRILSGLTIGLVLLAGAVPAAEQPDPAGTSEARPRLEIEERIARLGEVAKGEVVEARFTLRNTGDATLLILRAKPG